MIQGHLIPQPNYTTLTDVIHLFRLPWLRRYRPVCDKQVKSYELIGSAAIGLIQIAAGGLQPGRSIEGSQSADRTLSSLKPPGVPQNTNAGAPFTGVWFYHSPHL
jgi:hypothetical protein